MNYWIDIEDASGRKLGAGPIYSATYWENVNVLDGAGRFSFSMPAGDPRSEVVQSKRIARCFTMILGTPSELGSGIIDKITERIDVVGNTTLIIEGDNLLTELNRRSVMFLELTDGAGGGVQNSVSRIMSYAPAGWAVDGSVGTKEPAGYVYASFAGETVLNALVKVAELKGEHFRLQPGRRIAWLGSGWTASGLRAVQDGDPIGIENNADACVISDMEEERNTYEVYTRIYPFGSGNGDVRLTLASSNRPVPSGFSLNKTANCLINTVAEQTYGRIDKVLSFKDIAPVSNTDADLVSAANALFDQALVELRRHSKEERFYTMSVLKLDRLVYPGQTIRVVFKRLVDGYTAFAIDRDLYIGETTQRIDNGGIRTTGLKVATVDQWPRSDLEAIVSQMEEGRSMESHPQLSANAYVIGFREYMDKSNPARLDFFFDSEVLNVSQVLFRFKIEPLRSTIRSVSAQSTTSNSGGGSQQTSRAAGSGTYTSSSKPEQQYFASNQILRPDEINHYHYVNDTAHSHAVAIPEHQHAVDIPSHSHEFTAIIQTSYGIFEESRTNTLAETDLIYQVNDGAAIGRAVSLGSGWFQIDVTNLVSVALTHRPQRKSNQIKISTAAAKTATINGQLLVRTTIQAIAVY